MNFLFALVLAFVPIASNTSISNVYTWGGNNADIGTSAVAVGGLPADIVSVQAADWGGMAIDSAGNAWTWTRSTSPVASEVAGPTDVINLGEGEDISRSFGAAVTSGGALWTWGHDTRGDLCDGKKTTTHSLPPAPVSGVDNAVEATGGAAHLAFLTSTGAVWSCGGNSDGQLGNGSNADSNVPVEAKHLKNIVAISAGNKFTLALAKDGRVFAWGGNNFGQLGNGSTANSDVPVQVQLPSKAAEVFAGGSETNNGQSIALLRNGQVWAWGNDAWGQLGNGETEPYSDVPVQSTALPSQEWSYVATGGTSSFALDSAGNVYAWGGDSGGQLGDGTESTYVLDPEKVATGYSMISAVAVVFEGG
jgi:alpha-tubulin suppressor-like RCC1 family protein